MLCGVGWWFVTDVSGQHVGPICKGHADLEDGSNMLSINVSKYCPMLHNIPGQQRSQLHHGNANCITFLHITETEMEISLKQIFSVVSHSVVEAQKDVMGLCINK